MLLALAKKLFADASKADSGNLPIGTLTQNDEYAQLHYGDVEGIDGVTRTVEIDRTGNMIGFSPVERCIDRRTGEVAWIPTELIANLRLTPFPFVEGGTPTRGRKTTPAAATK
jgi:hypothetical protein